MAASTPSTKSAAPAPYSSPSSSNSSSTGALACVFLALPLLTARTTPSRLRAGWSGSATKLAQTLPALLFWEWHPWPAKLRPKVLKMMIDIRASFFSATLTARPAVPRGYLLASMSDPQTVSADDTVVGYSEQNLIEAPLGKPEGAFHDSIPGETGVGPRFRADSFSAN